MAKKPYKRWGIEECDALKEAISKNPENLQLVFERHAVKYGRKPMDVQTKWYGNINREGLRFTSPVFFTVHHHLQDKNGVFTNRKVLHRDRTLYPAEKRMNAGIIPIGIIPTMLD